MSVLPNTVFPLMRFKPRFSAVLLIFLLAEGCGCVSEGRGQYGSFAVFAAAYLRFPAVFCGRRTAREPRLEAQK